MSDTTPPTDFFVDSLTPKATITTNTAGTDESTGLRDAQLGEHAIGVIMHMLSNAYNDPIEAVIREIVTNGIDAHTVVGQKAPVTLAVPTEGQPTFAVIDRGVGMSQTELQENFADYGNSLKTDERETTGRFGIGAKSIYAVTNQFTVTTTQSGTTVTALFTVNDEGLPAHQIISSSFTDAPAGTTVTIPVEPGKLAAWRQRIATVVQYVEPGLVQLTAPGAITAVRPPEDEIHVGRRNEYPLAEPVNIRQIMIPELLGDHGGYLDYALANRRQGSSRQVIMGNIGYALPARMVGRYNHYLVLFAPPSSLELTHTREMIKDSEHNTAVLDHLQQQWIREIFSEQLEQISEAPAVIDKYRTVYQTARELPWQIHRDIETLLEKSDPAMRLLDQHQDLRQYLRVLTPHVSYVHGAKRHTDYVTPLRELARMLAVAPGHWRGAWREGGAQRPTTTVVLIDVGDEEVIDSQAKMSRLTQAVTQARVEHEASGAQGHLEVVAISRQRLAELAQEQHQRIRNQLLEESQEGTYDSLSKEVKVLYDTPLVDVDTLPWVDMTEFLSAHRPPRQARRPRAEQAGQMGLQLLLQEEPPARMLTRAPATRAETLSDEQVNDMLAAAPRRVVVMANAQEYTEVEDFVNEAALSGDNQVTRWLRHQLQVVPVVHRSRRSVEKVAAHFDCEVISLGEYLRQICRDLLASDDSTVLSTLMAVQAEVRRFMLGYRMMLDDTRLPQAVRDEVAGFIGDGQPPHSSRLFYHMLFMAQPEPGAIPLYQTTELEQKMVPERYRGDFLARRWPLLAEVYRGSSGTNERPSDELLRLVLGAGEVSEAGGDAEPAAQ